MSIRTFGRTLGLGAVLLSAVLLIVALVGGMTVDTPETETIMAHAVSSQANHGLSSSANGSHRYDDPSSIVQPGH